MWFQSGQTFKVVFAPSTDTDPPVSPYWTKDTLAGINDTTSTQAEWVSGPTPSFVNATSFTLAGDQTAIFTVGRRVRTTNTGGTVYSTITASVFGASTTITVVSDSGSLDSGLSAVSYGLLSSVNQALPLRTDVYPVIANNTDKTKRLSLNLALLNSSTNIVGTAPPISFYLGMPRGHLSGYNMSTGASNSSSMTVSAGAARDANNSTDIYLTAPITKNTGSWVVGSNGGLLDGGAVSSNAWYHWYAIQRIDTGLTDIGFSSTQASPPLPANYSFSRRIGSAKTNTSAVWIGFVQDGDLFGLKTIVQDISASNPGTSAVTRTLASVPTGINVLAKMQAIAQNTGAGGNVAVLLTDLETTDSTPVNGSLSDSGQTQAVASGVAYYSIIKDVRTNTSAQIRSRLSFSDASCGLVINTIGWIDSRGRD